MTAQQVSIKCEVLDWYHLKENLYKVGRSLKRLKRAENFLSILSKAVAVD
jgi:hypothetical protein